VGTNRSRFARPVAGYIPEFWHGAKMNSALTGVPKAMGVAQGYQDQDLKHVAS